MQAYAAVFGFSERPAPNGFLRERAEFGSTGVAAVY
jgi:hypothetical protein